MLDVRYMDDSNWPSGGHQKLKYARNRPDIGQEEKAMSVIRPVMYRIRTVMSGKGTVMSRIGVVRSGIRPGNISDVQKVDSKRSHLPDIDI